MPVEHAVQPRYRRAYDGDSRAVQSRQRIEGLRQSPLRHGLIGLAVAGTAAPIAINQYQQTLRTDPSHEDYLDEDPFSAADDSSISEVWDDLEGDRAAAEEEREGFIGESIRRYSDYGLSRELAENIYDVATENDIDPDVAFGLVRAESSFRNTSTSPVGAIGLTQLMPRTAEWLEPGVSRAQLRDPATNLRIGFKYLRSLIDKYDGDTDLALVAYNRGPGTVDRELRRGRDPDNGYAAFVRGVEDHGHSLYTSR